MLTKPELLLRYIPHNYIAMNKEIKIKLRLEMMEGMNGIWKKIDIPQVFDSLRIINNNVAKSFSRIAYLTTGKALPRSVFCINIQLNLIQKTPQILRTN